MPAAHDANSSGLTANAAAFVAGSGTATGSFELADPQFRFPVSTGDRATKKRGEANSAMEPPAKHVTQAFELAETPAQAIAHPAHGSPPAPHFQILPVERFVGWSMQEVAWTTSVESHNRPKATTVPASSRREQPNSTGTNEQPLEPSGDLAQTSGPAKSAHVKPLELPGQPTDQAPAKHWPTSSREQVTGFSVQRTRIDPPQAIVTGAGLAAGHRRWAARNLSAELQARMVAANSGGEPHSADSAGAQSAHDPANLAREQRAQSLGGGLPLVVHPDFRWSRIVEQLCQQPALTNPLLAAADQLLQAGNGRMLVAGARRQQGATTLAATISRLLIERGRRVLMVDADLARAGWTLELELTAAGSWVRQVEAFEPLQAAMAISRRNNSAVVALQPVAVRKWLPPFLLDYLGQLLQPLSEQFDATVIDLGPISQLLEELSQPERLGAALLIVQQGGPEAAVELRRAKTTLNAFGISRLAVAQNFAGSKAA
ncbi:MAG: hypothetical protein ACK56D_01775 [Planctomycetota bacterium]